MNVKELQWNWNRFSKRDPLWAILAHPEKKGNKWQLDEFFETGKEEINWVLKYTKALGIHIQGGRALDFGCGVGRLAQALSNYFEEVDGVDIAPLMLKLARKYNRHGERCKYYLNETDDLKIFPNDSFDFVYTNIVLQHMMPGYAKSYIREFLRVLSPQGILIFQLPSERVEQPSGTEPVCPIVQPRESSEMMKRIKQVIKQFTPKPVMGLYVKVRYAKAEPIMEMHCIKKEEVVSLLKENGAQILDIMEDHSAGPQFISFRYTVAKNQIPKNSGKPLNAT